MHGIRFWAVVVAIIRVGVIFGSTRSSCTAAETPSPHSLASTERTTRSPDGITSAPAWDASGLGSLPWQGIACLDVNDDASRIVVGTIAPPGDPNVLLLDGKGRLLRQAAVGGRWIDQVTVEPKTDLVRAVCTMPAGPARNRGSTGPRPPASLQVYGRCPAGGIIAPWDASI